MIFWWQLIFFHGDDRMSMNMRGSNCLRLWITFSNTTWWKQVQTHMCSVWQQPCWMSVMLCLIRSVWPHLSFLLQSVACQPPATHLGLLHHLREHTILFKPLLTLVLDYSHLRSLNPFQTAEHIRVRRPPPLPTQEKHLSPAAITRNKAELSHPSGDWDRTKRTNNNSPTKQNSYVTSKTISHVKIKVVPHQKAQPQAKVSDS